MTGTTEQHLGSTAVAAQSGAGAPVVYLLCGPPFAGKSTLARAMAERHGLVHLEVDAINRERGLGGDGGPLGRAEWAATYREAERRLGELLAGGRSVVYDATNFRRVMRDRLWRVAAGHGAAAVVVLVEPGAAGAAGRAQGVVRGGGGRLPSTGPGRGDAAVRRAGGGRSLGGSGDAGSG